MQKQNQGSVFWSGMNKTVSQELMEVSYMYLVCLPVTYYKLESISDHAFDFWRKVLIKVPTLVSVGCHSYHSL